MKRIIIVNGKPGSGKTTFENIFKNNCKQNVEILSIIDMPKKVAKVAGWNGKKNPHDRNYLSKLKDLLTEWNDFPYKAIKEKIDNGPDESFYFIDLREVEDIKRLKDEFRAITILIKRPKLSRIDKEITNHADLNVDKYEYDYVIKNIEGIDKLNNSVNYFIKKLGGELKRDK